MDRLLPKLWQHLGTFILSSRSEIYSLREQAQLLKRTKVKAGGKQALAAFSLNTKGSTDGVIPAA